MGKLSGITGTIGTQWWDEWTTGKTTLGNWTLLGETFGWEQLPAYFYYRLFLRLFLGANGRYRSIWHTCITITEEAFPQAFPADLDGDSADELVLVDAFKSKLQVFKIQ